MRDFEIYVPQDCVAATTLKEHRWALGQMESLLHADTRKSAGLRTGALVKRKSSQK